MTAPTLRMAGPRGTVPNSGQLQMFWGTPSPTPGDTLVAIVCGSAATGVFFGSGWTYRGQANNGSNDSISVYTKTATASEGPYTVTASTASGPYYVIIFELVGQPALHLAGGAAASYGSGLIGAGPFGAYPADTALRFVALEWDNRGPVPSTPSGWTLLGADTSTSPEVYHASSIYSAPATLTGAQPVQFSSQVNLPVWMDVIFVSPPAPASGARPQVIWWF